MGFLDKAKAAATDLKASVDSSMSASNAGRDVERHYRDLGMISYLQQTGRSVDEADRQRVFTTLQQLEARGVPMSFHLSTAPPQAPPPPGANAAGGPPPPPGAAAPPPPGPAAGPPPAAPPPGGPPPPGAGPSLPPPPPPPPPPPTA